MARVFRRRRSWAGRVLSACRSGHEKSSQRARKPAGERVPQSASTSGSGKIPDSAKRACIIRTDPVHFAPLGCQGRNHEGDKPPGLSPASCAPAGRLRPDQAQGGGAAAGIARGDRWDTIAIAPRRSRRAPPRAAHHALRGAAAGALQARSSPAARPLHPRRGAPPRSAANGTRSSHAQWRHHQHADGPAANPEWHTKPTRRSPSLSCPGSGSTSQTRIRSRWPTCSEAGDANSRLDSRSPWLKPWATCASQARRCAAGSANRNRVWQRAAPRCPPPRPRKRTPRGRCAPRRHYARSSGRVDYGRQP